MQSDLQALSNDEAEPAVAVGGLSALRANLDSIDDAIHDLLMRRAEVVGQIAAVKTGAALRPGREASIIRRLLARHGGRMPASTIVRIWREILSASTGQQQSFSAAVYEPATDGRFAAVARAQFGALTPIRACRSAAQAIGEVAEGRASVAVLPLPGDDDAGAPWWPSLLQRRKAGGIHVIARLPFWHDRPEGTPQAQALVVATTPADASGDDVSLIALETAAEISRGGLANALTAAGFRPNVVVMNRPSHSNSTQILVEVAGYVAPDDARLGAIRGFERPALLVGAYAVPVGGKTP
jgi:chorismate mutase / prephenate dehydratase